MLIGRTPQRTDATALFTTHSNYLRAFATLASERRTGEDIYAACAERMGRSGCLPTQRIKTSDHAQIQTSLRHAWGTELLMALTGEMGPEDEIVRLSNSWMAVQTYYCVYHGTQAVSVAAGQARPTAHPTTQRIFTDQWTSTSKQLAPWGLAYGPDGPINVPPTVSIDQDVRPLRPFDSRSTWSLAVKALQHTRT